MEIEYIDGSRLSIESREMIGCGKVIVVPGRGLATYLFPGELADVVAHPTLLWPKALDQEKRARLVNAFGKNNV
jgi:hypothetical protein